MLISKKTNCRKCRGELIRHNIQPKKMLFTDRICFSAKDYAGHEVFVCYTCDRCGAKLETAMNGDTFQS